MRITFIGGSLEPGEDGVGDYTRWLAIESERQGASCRLVALADRAVTSISTERIDRDIEILRLPSSMPWAERIEAAGSFIQSRPPDWVSLQFVPYSFQRRGLAGKLVRALGRLVPPARLHVMFHEIWIEGRDSLQRRLVSAAQRRSIVALGSLPGALIHTSNTTYQQMLQEQGVDAELLPLFGSIPVATSDARDWLAPLLAEAGCDALSGQRQSWWLLLLFGSLHPVWPPEPLITELLTAAASAGKRVVLVSVGRMGSGEPLWHDIQTRYGSRLPMLRLGAQPADRISELLNTVDFGIATTPLALVGKSATVAAMFDHGLPVIVNREDCSWDVGESHDAREIASVIRMGPDFAAHLARARKRPSAWRLPEVAARWLGELRGVPASAA